MKQVVFIMFLGSLVNGVQSQKLKVYDRVPREIIEHHTLLTLNEKRGFHIYSAGCVAGQMRFAVGIFDIIDKGSYSEFHYKSVSEYHAVKSHEYEFNPNSPEFEVTVIDINGDTLLLDSLVLGKEKNYELKSKKGINASSGYNKFTINPNNQLTHFTIPGFYRLFQHDVIFELPSENFNAITIQLTIPLGFYIHDESFYKSIGSLDYGIVKMEYFNNTWSYYKAKQGGYSFSRDEIREAEYFKTFKRKPFKKKK